MIELKNSLIEVRKAYRLLYDYQKKVLDLVNFIGSEFGRTYNGGYPKYCNVTPRNGKGSLKNWAWDWLNMYYYEFNFHNDTVKFSIVLISDTGFYESITENPSLSKLDLNNFKNAESSVTKLSFVYGDKIWKCEGFLENDCWQNPKFVLGKEGIYIAEHDSGKMLFKSYNLENFSTKEKTLEILRDFSGFCKRYNIEFKLKRDIEIEQKASR